MVILYIVHQFYPEFHTGTEKFLLNLSSVVQKDGHFAQLVTYSFAEDEERFEQHGSLLVREYVYKGLPVVAIKHKAPPTEIHTSCGNPEIYKFALWFLQQKGPYDLLHIAHPMRLTAFAKAALTLGIPYLLTLTDYWLICPKTILQTRAGTLCAGPEGGEACSKLCPELDPNYVRSRLGLANEILTGAKAVVSPSMFLAAVFKKEFPALNIRVIPHGMDFKYLQPNLKTYQQGEKITFGYCGGLSPHKGVHLLLKAFRELNPENAELRVYGTYFHEKDYYRCLQEIAGRDERIKFCGTYKEEEVGNVLSKIDVMVLPSLWYENYPLVLHEALACNVPVIAANIGGMAEEIKDFVNGFTFQVGNTRDLKHKLRAILDDPESLNEIKETMKQYVAPLVEEEAYLYERLYKADGSD